jgi:hypothetical protein
MAKMNRVFFNTNYYDLGEVKFQKGYHYPVTDETKTRILAGDAEMRQVDMDPEVAKTEQAAAQDELSTERAATIAAEGEASGKGKAE